VQKLRRNKKCGAQKNKERDREVQIEIYQKRRKVHWKLIRSGILGQNLNPIRSSIRDGESNIFEGKQEGLLCIYCIKVKHSKYKDQETKK
jgi:hypothetical protein